MYLDTAILLKLFVKEADSEYYAELTDGQIISSSFLAYTEVWSALLAKERGGSITADQRQKAWAAFEMNTHADTICLVPTNDAIYRRANRIMEQCHPQVPLRSLDALHLATCDQIQDWPLCTNDQRMRRGAELLRFPITDLPK